MQTTLGESIAVPALHKCLRLIQEELLPNGEMPNYRLMPNKTWEYCFSPLASAYVHEALSCFDPLSDWFEAPALAAAGPRWQLFLARTVSDLRRSIRRFLAWQEECAGGWRFFGLGSGLPPDLEMTACASGVLLDCGSRESATCAGRKQVLDQFRCEDGSFDSPGSRGHSEQGVSAERGISNANAARYLALIGSEVGSAPDVVEKALTEEHVSFALYYSAARAWKQGQLPAIDRIAERIIPDILNRLSKEGSPGPLSTALAVGALLDLGASEVELSSIVPQLLAYWESPHGRNFESFGDPRCGSPAMTASFSMAALARLAFVIEESFQ